MRYSRQTARPLRGRPEAQRPVYPALLRLATASRGSESTVKRKSYFARHMSDKRKNNLRNEIGPIRPKAQGGNQIARSFRGSQLVGFCPVSLP